MDFELTEEQAALREVSRSMLAVSCPPQLVRSLASAGRDLDDKLWQRGAELARQMGRSDVPPAPLDQPQPPLPADCAAKQSTR